MASAKYLGYVGGAAVAVGVGAALATAGQGTAHAEADGKTTAAESKGPERKTDRIHKDFKAAKADTKDPAAKLQNRLTKLSDDTTAAVKSAVKPPKFDPSDAVKKLQKQFKADVAQATTKIEATAQAESDKANARFTDLATKANAAAASLTKLAAITRADVTTADITVPTADVTITADEVAPTPPAWSLNPLRPMPPEPAPTDMPGALWDLEKTFVNVSPDLLKPFIREGYELGYRVSQMIPWVNAIVPVINIAGDLAPALQGDKYASQRIINNLIVTLAPVSFVYYGYDALADLANLEVPAQNLKQWVFATAWGIDLFNWFHVPGQSGIPLSTASPDWWCTTTSCDVPSAATGDSNVNLARAFTILSTDDLGSDPFRADDPWPTGMPAEILSVEKGTVALLNGTPLAAVSPYYREAYEAVYRGSQLVPWLNVPIPVSAILAAINESDPSVAQIAINQLLLTTPLVSTLYYGYDEFADLLNVEASAAVQKDAFYQTVWDTLDSGGALHVLGQSGLPTSSV